MREARSVSSLRSRFVRFLLANRNGIAAYLGAVSILNGIDATWPAFIGVGFLIGWFVHD